MKTQLQRWTRRIRRGISKRYDLNHLKKLAFGIALATCLLLGLIMLFSLYALSLHNTVGLSYTEINIIVLLSAVGMYLCLPVLGYLADCYGPALLLLISIWAFCPAYFVNALLVNLVRSIHFEEPFAELNKMGVLVMAFSFCFIGLATSSLYFSSLLTCAKIYPDHKSLAISLPVSCYGVSSLIGAQLMKVPYFHVHGGKELDLERVFMFFAVLYLFMGALNFVSNSIVSIETDIIFGDEEPVIPESEVGTPADSILENGEANEETELLPQRSNIEPVDHKARYIRFLKDKSAWALLISLLLNIGPMESFQNNLGSIIESTTGGEGVLADQVSVIALLSTVIRLIVGVVADYISSSKRRFPICKVWLMIGFIVIGIVAQIAVIYGFSFTTISVLSGICYGGLFTIYPTIIASVWGVDLMGSTWGSFMVAPAIGSILYSLLHGEQMDACKNRGNYEKGSDGCLEHYFITTAVSLFVSLVFVVVAWRAFWWKRGLKVF